MLCLRAVLNTTPLELLSSATVPIVTKSRCTTAIGGVSSATSLTDTRVHKTREVSGMHRMWIGLAFIFGLLLGYTVCITTVVMA